MKHGLSRTINLVWPNDISQGSAVFPPLGIGYISSYLVEKGFDVKIYDSTFDRNLRLSKKRAIYGVAITTPLLNLAKVIITEIKKANKDNIIIAGGPHATIMPESLMKEVLVDYAVAGEGEVVFHRLCTAILNNKSVQGVKGVYYRARGAVRFTGGAELIQDLDELPPPRYDLFPLREYMNAKPIKELNMVTSRGCPFDCIFCQPYLRNAFGIKIKCRSPKKIVDEIERIKLEIKPHVIFFCDDMAIPAYVRELCNEIIRRNVRILWRCQARVCLDKDLLRLMKRAGCINIAFGVESGSQKVLDALNKSIKVERVVQQFQDCREVGIFTHAFLMVGNPGETEEDIKKTIAHVEKIKPFSIYVSITTPYPGTHLFNLLKQENKLPKNIDWGSMNQYKDETFYVNISEMTKEEVVKAKHLVLESFKKTNKLSRAKCLGSYLKDLDGIRTLFFFVVNNPTAIFRVLKTFILMSRSGSGLDATNPKSDSFDDKKCLHVNRG